MKRDVPVISFQLDLKTLAELDALAEDLERSRAYLIRKAIQQYLDRI